MATASLAMTEETDVLRPGSEEEAIEAFADGTDVLVVGGGTIVVPDITYGRLQAQRALLLNDAGLTGITRDGSRTTIGATTTVEELVGEKAPLGPCAAKIADVEIRAVATVGGNLCAGEGGEVPRGDLQGAFLALGATVRSAGEGGVTEEALEDFLPNRRKRLVLSISFEEPAAGAFAALDRRHAHDYTTLAVSAARGGDGTVRLGATGVANHAVRLPSAEAKADNPQAAGDAALGDATFTDDAIASAWYRQRVLPVLVRRALTQLQEAT